MKEVLICAEWFSYSSAKTLQCGDQQVIDIKRSIAGNYRNLQCNEAEIIPWFKNPYVGATMQKKCQPVPVSLKSPLLYIRKGKL